MSNSGITVIIAAFLFLIAAACAINEGKPPALIFAYFSLFLANLGFGQL